MGRELWARVIPWQKDVAIAALESGVETLWVPDDRLGNVRELGRVTAVCSGGDLCEGRDFRVTRMQGKGDETALLTSPPETIWVVRPEKREVIPLENLVAHRRKILVVASTPEEVALYRGVLERGVHGIILEADSPAGMRRLASAARFEEGRVPLVSARVTEVASLGIGDRVCVDTCSLIEGYRGMLVGNSSAGLFLVCAENVPNPYVLPRPFRVNAGAVHSYCRLPEGRTGYLSELSAGSAVLLVNGHGEAEVASVGRVKVERRPLLLVRADGPGGESHSVILQNAETIRLADAAGGAISVARLSAGDSVLLAEERAGRHFGIAVEETIREN
ncbi:MAG TPA: 3-dehydroquinate synthase II [Candidatus Deferrimicrobiaceae bacterium]|nr:3-dehydroquinate synthase II [Candidatus Deferrimicrobiaceae bacterium]